MSGWWKRTVGSRLGRLRYSPSRAWEEAAREGLALMAAALITHPDPYPMVEPVLRECPGAPDFGDDGPARHCCHYGDSLLDDPQPCCYCGKASQ